MCVCVCLCYIFFICSFVDGSLGFCFALLPFPDIVGFFFVCLLYKLKVCVKSMGCLLYKLKVCVKSTGAILPTFAHFVFLCHILVIFLKNFILFF